MGSLILCHKKKASQPYKITRIHRKIYTIEELCYYLCNNLYLIDYTIMNEKICEWLYSELDMKEQETFLTCFRKTERLNSSYFGFWNKQRSIRNRRWSTSAMFWIV